MGNCLKSQLKENIQNNNLEYYGFYKIVVSHTNNISKQPRIVLKEDATIKASGNFLSTSSDLSNLTDEIPTAASGTNVYCVNPAEGQEYVVWVGGKYGSCDNLNIQSPALNFDIKDLKYKTISNQLVLYGTNATGDVANLSNIGNVKELRLQENNLYGNIGDIVSPSNPSSITIINILDNNDVEGDLSGISSLINLTILSISYTNISGNISAISGMTKLTEMALRQTTISGSIDTVASAQASSRSNGSTLRITGNGIITYKANGDGTGDDVVIPDGTVKTITFDGQGGYSVA